MERTIAFETHDRELLTGDAFLMDRLQRSQKVCGQGVQQKASTFTSSGPAFQDTPESKCNAVAFMKMEKSPLSCRNILAVNDSFICYSVKKTMLRIIHQQSANKGLLKGHQHPILDIKFAATNDKMLCSVDDGEAAEPLTIVWRLLESNGVAGDSELSHEMCMSLPMRASTVQSYPHHQCGGDVWAIAHKNKFGIISTKMSESLKQATEYHQLPMNSQCIGSNSVIADICFSADGETLAIGETGDDPSQSQITLWALPSVDVMSAAAGRLASPSRILPVLDGRLLSCRFLNQTDLLTCSNAHARDGGDVYNVVLQLWYGSAAGARATQFGVNKPVQTVNIHLPTSPDSASPSAQSALDCSLVTTSPIVKFACVASRCSPYVACCTIARHEPQLSNLYPLSSSIAHLSNINLKFPVFSISASIIALKDEHHSADDVEHLEMSCYQEQSNNAGQAAVQQFILPTSQLAPPTFATAAPSWFVALDEPSSPGLSSAPGASAAVPAAEQKGRDDLFSKLFNMLGSNSGNAAAPAAATPAPAPAPVPVVPAPVALVATAVPVGPPASAIDAQPARTSLLEILGKPPASPASSALPTPASLAAAGPPSAPGLPDLLRPSGHVMGQSLLDMVKSKQTGGAGSGLGGLGLGGLTGGASSIPGLVSPAAVSPAPAATPKAPSPITISSPLGGLTGSASSGSGSSLQALGSSLSKSNEDDWAAAAASLSGSLANASSPSRSGGADVALGNDLMNVGTMESVASTPVATAPEASTSSVSLAPLQQTVDKIHHILLNVGSRAAEEAKARTKAEDKMVASVDKNTAKTVEREVKKILDSKPWRDELAASISASISQSLGQSLKEELTQAVGQKVRDTVRDTVKSTLASTFTRAFENSLLPAFQAGTDRMFAQLQSSFETGMDGLAEQDRASAEAQRGMVEVILSMQSELVSMRTMMKTMEARIGELKSTGVAGAGAQPQLPSDPLTLLAQGHIAEAVESSLEHKDTELLTKVLSQLTCAQVVANCSTLVILCTTQQLAVDLAATVDPVEGLPKRLEWIKSLVLHLVYNPAASADTGSSDHIQTVLASVRESIAATQARCSDSSVLTDLTMMSHIVSSKL